MLPDAWRNLQVVSVEMAWLQQISSDIQHLDILKCAIVWILLYFLPTFFAVLELFKCKWIHSPIDFDFNLYGPGNITGFN